MISAVNVSLSYGKRVLFDEVNISFTKGNCYGIIGANGVGKSTFLKILSGEIFPSKGQVEIAPGQRLAVLKQNQFEFDNHTVLNTVLMGHKKLWKLIQDREELYAKADFDEKDGNLAAQLEEEFGEMGGYMAESDAASLLSDLGVEEQLHQLSMSELASNLKVRVLLAQALYGNPDILLLDEPTNGLDVTTIKWLENFLADYENVVIVVSHDRHFLDAVCTHVVDIDRERMNIFTGNYTFWYESSLLASRQLADKNKKTEDRRKELMDFIARFSANASKSKQATSRKKALEKLNIEQIQPSSRKYPGIIFKPEREVGDQILKVENLSGAIDGKTLFSNINFAVNKGDKIAILAKDQMAVHCFFDILGGKITPTAGSMEWGITISKAYLPVDVNFHFEKDLELMDWLRGYVPPTIKDVDEVFLRGYLGRMLFTGDDVFKKCKVMSGGEKVRAVLSMMMLQGANTLLLDEPTNHLDLESIQAFNENMVDFGGIILISSHDHTFLQTVCNRVIEITPSGCIDKLMTYDEYIDSEEMAEVRESMYA